MIPAGVRIWAAASPVDMRRGFVGLAQAAREQLSYDPSSGALFIFTNKRRNRLKLLWHDRSGFCLLYKRLERGQFRLPHMDPNSMAVEIDATQLAMLLDGIDYGRVRRPKHWEPPQSDHPAACPMDKSPST